MDVRRFDPAQKRDPNGEWGDGIPGPGPAVAFAGKVAGAATEADALAAAPVRKIRDDGTGTIALDGVPKLRQRDLLMATIAYSGGEHADINAVLRGHAVRGSKPVAEANIAKIDEAMSHSPLARDVVVFRGIQDGRAVFGDAWRGDLTGVEFRPSAYSSTTADRRIVDDFIDRRDPAPTELRIFVPAGTHAINLSGYGDEHIDEAELLLDRDLTYRVISDTTVHGRRHLDVEVLS